MELINEIDETFVFNEKDIRILGSYNEPLFVAKDICTVLGLSNVTEALKSIPQKWKKIENLTSVSLKSDILYQEQGRNMIILSEPAVYKLIMRSNKPVAQKFQEVVCEEILPTLRKKGEYKIQSILDRNKELEEEKLKIEEENKRLEAQKIEIEKKLFVEQKTVIKTKLSLELNQKKFRHRYKFIDQGGCVYILKDPENPLNKFKIGFTDDINERLRSDRTMIPTIKVLFIMYTPHYELFEKLIKIRFEEHFQFQSHEWIILDKFENVNFIINGYKEIDKSCVFHSKIEENLWQYNLEEPPVLFHSEEKSDNEDGFDNADDESDKESGEEESKCELSLEADSELFEKKHLNFAGKLSLILPTYLLRYDYDKKNEVAGDGFRYCNGYCQGYQNINLFTMKSLSPLTICMKCDSMIDIADIKITNGVLTPEQIRRDPTLLEIKDNEQICRKCYKIKNKDEFPEKRRQCKNCRNGTRSKNGKNFDNIIDEEIRILNELTFENKIVKINTYVKDELQKIISYLKIGRKFNDNKQIMIDKIIAHYKI
jgi:prophage antirepressor-like protein